MVNTAFLQPSSTPVEDIKKLAYKGQDPLYRMYRTGYERYMAALPVLHADDELLQMKLDISRSVTNNLAQTLRDEWWVTNGIVPAPGQFNRTIIGVESPVIDAAGNLKEKAELIVAKWGDGFTSPIHGHADGLLLEEILFGKIRINQYRVTDPVNRIVRPTVTDIVTQGTFLNTFNKPNPELPERSHYVHSFTSIGYSATLHYIPEHTRDGRDNSFKVEYFDDHFQFHNEDLIRIDSKQGMYLRPGSVVMVRSENVPEYGDHYIVITGKPVMKQHGLRPADFAIESPTNKILDKYHLNNGLILLHLQDEAQAAFHEFHNIQL